MMAQNCTVNNTNSKINFAIKNIGLTVNGSFSVATGNVIFDNKDLKNSDITISVNANSVDTDNNARDKHLRQADYFDVEQFPTIAFKSVKIEKSNRLNRYNLEGILTIKGISKTIKLELIATEKDQTLDLKCNFDINRRTFKVGGNSLVLSDNVKMNINIVCNK